MDEVDATSAPPRGSSWGVWRDEVLADDHASVGAEQAPGQEPAASGVVDLDPDGDVEFDIELVWPTHDAESSPRPARTVHADGPGVPIADEPGASVEPVLPALAASIERLESEIVRLSGRLDAIDATVNKLRVSIPERLRDQGEIVIDQTTASVSAALDDVGSRLLARFDRADAASSATLADAVDDIREQIVLLKRRLGVRAKATVVLDDAQLDDIATRVARVLPEPSPAPERLTAREVRRIAGAIAEQIEQRFEVVSDPGQPV